MLRSIYLKSMFDRRKSINWWFLGIGLLVVGMSLFFPYIRDNDQMSELLEAYPQEVLQFLGVTDISTMFTPAGFLQAELFSFMVPIIFIIYSVGFGAGAIAGEEDQKTLDLLLANPVSRTQVVLHKMGAMVSLLLTLGLVLFASLLVGGILADMNISAINLLAVSVQTALLALVFGSITLTLGAVTGQKGLSVGISVALAIIAFFANTLANNLEWLEPAQKMSPFYYAYAGDPLVNGFDWFGTGVMVLVIAALTGIAVWGFNRRDLSV